MNKLDNKYFKLLILIWLSLISFTIPVKAVIINQSQSSQTKIDRRYLAFSWGDFIRIFRRKKSKGGSKGSICLIVPQQLDEPVLKIQGNQEIWSLNPLFLWNIRGGTTRKIELFEKGSNKILWSKEVSPGKTQALYDGKPLQPGSLYEWRIIADAPFPIKSITVNFKVMESDRIARISKELAQLEQRLKNQGANAETIALEKVEYFTRNQLWSDALREIYTLKNPSPRLKQLMQQIPSSDYCNRTAILTKAVNLIHKFPDPKDIRE